jgi:uncharacterized membrane protein (DUF4010 family)
MSLASQARRSPQSARLLGVAAVAANAVQFPRLLLLVAVIASTFAQQLASVLVPMTIVGLLGAALLSGRLEDRQPDVQLPLTNPYSLTPALKFTLFFVAILFLVRFAEDSLGDQGVLLASLLGGAASASAVSLSLAKLVQDGSLSVDTGMFALLICVSANATVKLFITLTQGARRLAFWLGGGLLTMLATGYLLLFLRVTGAT